jgi:hypothetical protein
MLLGLLPAESRGLCNFINVNNFLVQNIYIYWKTCFRDNRETKIRRNGVCKMIHNKYSSNKFGLMSLNWLIHFSLLTFTKNVLQLRINVHTVTNSHLFYLMFKISQPSIFLSAEIWLDSRWSSSAMDEIYQVRLVTVTFMRMVLIKKD